MYTEETGISVFEPTSAEVEREFFLWNNEALPGLGIDKNILLDKVMQLMDRSDATVQWRL